MLVKRQERLRIADFGLRISKRAPVKANPKSEIRNPKSKRSALSLTEVLIAMGILTLGLLGVASVFPVGSFYMQKAEVSDRGSAIAQSVMNDLMASGMLNPRAWFVMVPKSTDTVNNILFPSDGKFSPNPPPPTSNVLRGTFTRPLGLTLNEALTQATAATDKTVIARQFGSAFVIDPLGVSVMARQGFTAPPTGWAHGPGAVFPAGAYQEASNYMGYAATNWAPWFGTSSPKGADGLLWPVRRATFRQTNTGVQMDSTMASHYFHGHDDLATDLPSRDDRPAIQKWEQSSSGAPLGRQWVGDYSWIVTVVPITNAARDGMGTTPEAFDYDVSVIVFYKRVLPDTANTVLGAATTPNQTRYEGAMSMNERAVRASVISSGLNGGELLLTDWGDVIDLNGNPVNAFDNLRTGQWIMLCGPHPNSNVVMSGSNYQSGEPRMFLSWYQVVSIDKEGAGISGFDTKTQRVVALRGAQWPWQPASAGVSSPYALSNDLCVAICPGAVAVNTKTMRLEGRNSTWSVPAGGVGGGDGGFGGGGGPTGTTTPWTPF